jgi:two-component system cell cycle sensor histidine kinase/response regulator CckA
MPIAPQCAAMNSSASLSGVDSGWWRHLFSQSSEPQFICDRGGLVREVNPAATELLALAGSASILDKLFDAHTKEQIRKILARDLSGTETLSAVGVRAPDGTCLAADLRLTPFEHGCWLIGIKLAARQLRVRDASESHGPAAESHDTVLIGSRVAHSILNSLEGSLYLLDGRCQLIAFSDGWLKMPPEHGWLKFTEAPEAGRSLLDYVGDAHRRLELEKAFSAVLAEGQRQQLQAVDALGRHWLMDVLPWRHEGRIRGLVYKVTDNTAFVGVQNQLFHAQKLGTVGALAAGVAHDFNNLLLAIRGNVGLLLLDANLNSEAHARLEQVDNAASRAGDLSQQLLSFSRPSEEKVAVLDFNEVIQEAATLTQRLLRGKVTLELQSSPEPAKVQIDGTRASQVLLNLCVNAHDAMPTGGKITLSNAIIDLTEAQAAKVRRKPGEKFVRCSVADTGTGIPPEFLPRIFNPFFTTKEKGKGTGLGLSIVNGVISRAGGFIEVESALNIGTSFHVYLPIDRGPVRKPDTELRHKIRSGTGRLLVVDDLDLVLEFATSFLNQAGYQVLTATSAEGALRILAEEKEPVDLLLTDYAMPEKNGWQLIQEVQARWPRVKCVLASGYLEDIERAQISKSVRILDKPFGIAEATTVIAEILLGSPR